MNHGYLSSFRGPRVPGRPRGAVQAPGDRLCRQRQRPRPDLVTPIRTATNTAGPPITVGTGPDAIAIT